MLQTLFKLTQRTFNSQATVTHILQPLKPTQKPKLQKECAYPTREKLFFKIFFPSKNFKTQPHNPRQTSTLTGYNLTQSVKQFDTKGRRAFTNIKLPTIFFCGADEQDESACNLFTFGQCDSDELLIPAKKYCGNS